MSELENKVLAVIETIKHPAIDLSLTKLGMIKNIVLEDSSLSVDFCFPFPNIPIKEALFESVRSPMKEMGVTVSINESIMSQEEVQQFLALETANWKN